MNAWYALCRAAAHVAWLARWPHRWWRARELDKSAAVLDMAAAQLDGIGDDARAEWQDKAQVWRDEAKRLRGAA